MLFLGCCSHCQSMSLRANTYAAYYFVWTQLLRGYDAPQPWTHPEHKFVRSQLIHRLSQSQENPTVYPDHLRTKKALCSFWSVIHLCIPIILRLHVQKANFRGLVTIKYKTVNIVYPLSPRMVLANGNHLIGWECSIADW